MSYHKCMVMEEFVIDSCVCGLHFPNLLVSNYCIVMKNCCVSAKNVTVQLHP